ncbi:hypothetical protein [Litoreibacter arenae]|uniref:Uncharacterized protein n=1 Tax=Litoreibacter arenae DSM 19593 TaxID=1123360 RepID=S9RZ97_9RHOB|nr:hypothetical protein [Litoreibacter arenae]EPX79304.1 hypothetical protein thalar_02129 [Litoreibacter arenae DSM 19593]
MSLKPGDVTARSEHSGMKNAGEMGSECQICARPVGVRFFYDDPLNTPITDLEVKLTDMSGATLVEGLTTEAPVSRGLQDATSGVGALRSELGGVVHGEVPFSAGAVTATTNPSQDIKSAADDAWAIEQDIVGKLWNFEQSMLAKFQPYVDEWERDGLLGAGADYYKGVGKGIANWWNGEKDFWGSAWGALKSSAAAVEQYTRANPELLLGPLGYMIHAQKLGMRAGQSLAEWFSENSASVGDFLGNLTSLMRALLIGDIDGVVNELESLTGLEDIPGAIGDFGKMLKDAMADGIDWIRDMIEMIRRTPVLGLIANTAMRCIMLMTPNYWAKVIGEGVGFVIPEVLIWVITILIGALSSGAGSVILAQRCAGIASKLRSLIKGSQHVSRLLSFLDELRPIVNLIGDLAKKLRQSINEIRTGIVDSTQKLFRRTRYYRGKLDDLARQGHGPQRHEGDVTDKALFDRVYRGKDPATGRMHPRDRRGRIRGVGKHSTKFHTPADYVRAYEKALKHPDFKSFKGNSALDRQQVEIPMSDIFGPNFQARVRGFTRASGRTGRQPTVVRTVFSANAKVVVRFKRENGIIKLITMYPEP